MLPTLRTGAAGAAKGPASPGACYNNQTGHQDGTLEQAHSRFETARRDDHGERPCLRGVAQAVGKRIAAHTRAAKLVRRRLVVEVEDQIWQRQLFVLSYHIVRNLERQLGPDVVEDLEFRVVPRRREPQRAAQSAPALAADEADTIADPVLRGLYKASRARARA